MPETTRYEVNVPATKLFAGPSRESSIATETLLGEAVEVITAAGEFYSVRTKRYAKPLYVLQSHVAPHKVHRRSVGHTHRVSTPRANIYLKPDMKFPDPDDRALTMNALARVTDYARTPEGEMAYVVGMGWVFRKRLHRIDEFYDDLVSVALMYVSSFSTYTYGSLTLPDCSGLIPQAFWACGMEDCPRNVSEQITMIGENVDMDDVGFAYRRGDFVFMFDPERSVRHVVLMVDSTNCVHSTIQEPYQGVRIQPLSEVIKHQFKGERYRPTAVRRLSNQ